MKEIVYLNGELLPHSEAKVSIDDYGFLYGYALFETMRAYGGKIFLLERHLERLRASAGEIEIELTGIDFARACYQVLEANGLKNARLRLTVSRGEVDSFPGLGKKTEPTVLITARSYEGLPAQVYEKGYQAIIASIPRCALSPLSRLKTANYLTSVLAKTEAVAAGFEEALMLNERGKVAEGSISNVFLVQDDVLVTPPVASGILPGITRQVVMELAREMMIKVNEREVTLEELARCDEAFLTNSVIEIMPLVGVQHQGRKITIGDGKPGLVTIKLMVAYREMVRRETGLGQSC
ncbi:aminotransferase class IV [Chloroflexota bacterium]